MLPNFLILFIFLNYSLGSVDEPKYSPYEDKNLEISLIFEMLDRFKPESISNDSADNQIAPQIDGNFIVSVLSQLLDLTSFVWIDNKSERQVSSFNKAIDEKFYPLVRQFYNSNPAEFLRFTINSEFRFLLPILTIDSLTISETSFTILAASFNKFLRPQGGSNGLDDKIPDNSYFQIKEFYVLFAILFAQSKISALMEKPLVSQKEWESRKEIVKLHIQLLSMTDLILNSNHSLPINSSMSIEIYKYNYLLDNFSVFNENEIDFQCFQRIYKRLVKIAGNYIEKEDRFTLQNSEGEILFYLFRLFARHLFYSEFMQINFSQMDTKLLCCSAMSIGIKHFRLINSYFILSTEGIVDEAIEILRKEFERNFIWEISTKCPLLAGYFQACKFDLKSPLMNKIFRNYAEGAFDTNDLKCELDKPMIKVYLHLLNVQKKISQSSPEGKIDIK
jgi:hypothetical protein